MHGIMHRLANEDASGKFRWEEVVAVRGGRRATGDMIQRPWLVGAFHGFTDREDPRRIRIVGQLLFDALHRQLGIPF